MTASSSSMSSAPEQSAVDQLIATAGPLPGSDHAQHLVELALLVKHNLEHQHDWRNVQLHTHGADTQLPRPILSGVPPRRLYIHPDEQIELIKAGIRDDDAPPQAEWVFPSHLREKWSLEQFAGLFDRIDAVPPAAQASADSKWRQVKRALLATVDDDSTVIYYIVHDGVVKPRQN